MASYRDRKLLHACLDSLLEQCDRLNAELVVARANGAHDIDALARHFPTARFIEAPAHASIPELRALGMSAASGDIVALTEDHCVADECWLETISRPAAEGAQVVGGGMDNAQRSRIVDWAAYFAEYGFFAPGRPAGEDGPLLLTGANVAYRRDVVADVIAWAGRGEWENVAHDRLFASGSIMRFASTAAIYQNQQYTLGSFCVDRYVHGRDYAQKRLAEQPGLPRWLLLVGTPLLPLLLTWRVGKAVGPRGRGAFLRALPATFVFFSAWATGEAVGYLRGKKRSEDDA